MKDRIKQLRKKVGLTQQEFGEKIGIKANTVGNYEIGLRTPSDAVIKSICREFNVSNTWLREGVGDMFNQVESDDELNLIMESIGATDPTIVRILKAYWHLSETEKAAVRKLVDNIAAEYNKKNNPE